MQFKNFFVITWHSSWSSFIYQNALKILESLYIFLGIFLLRSVAATALSSYAYSYSYAYSSACYCS